MEQKRARLDPIRRKLHDDFQHLGSTEPSSHTVMAGPAVPTVPAPAQIPAPSTPLLCAVTIPPAWQSPGSPPMACATAPTWSGGYCEGEGTRWPDAGLHSSTPSAHLYFGSTSGSSNPQTLSSSSQYSVGWPVDMSMFQPTLPQPTPPSGSLAFCFHCLQFGKVFTVSPV